MGRGYIGESGADKALDKMDKFMKRKKEESKFPVSILDQLKSIYPDTWKEELEKMRKEHKK